ncbi:MAG: hypothetical protein L0220_08740 [Acidobacteria bacterium]|nr:hypothetical protein [Acidobacteriota bacterium]
MSKLVYNIPVSLVPAYRGQNVIVRSESPDEIVEALPEGKLEKVLGVQLLSLSAEADPMAGWGYAIPVELVMRDPVTEFALLYRHARLIDKHPVSASIPAIPGLSKAVKIANSLQFRVKLELGQPVPAAIAEMLTAVDYYLHHTSVSQPIEFFHTTLTSFYHRDPLTLWDVQEEDPGYLRYVTEDGRESIARRLVSADAGGNLDSFIANLQKVLLGDGRGGHSECYDCEFLANCGGYFKWPNQDYACDGVKSVFRALKEAADELRRDLDNYAELRLEVAQ